jgi:hypothetical protein
MITTACISFGRIFYSLINKLIKEKNTMLQGSITEYVIIEINAFPEMNNV